MPYCPIFGWYNYKDPNLNYAINSVITGSIKPVGKTNRAHIATDKLQTLGKHLECAISPYVKKVLEEEAEGQKGKVRHYGLIIVRPGKNKLSASKVVDFISFHRHPKKQTSQPTPMQYGISAYNEVFEEKVLEEAPPSNKEVRPTKRKEYSYQPAQIEL